MDKFFMLLIFAVASTAQKQSPSLLFKKLLSNYVMSDPPSKDQPTEVKIGMYINNFYDIDHGESMQMTSSMYLRQQWTDPRLAYNKSQADSRGNIRLPEEYHDQIWRPDLFVRNTVEFTKHQSILNNALIKISDTGSVWFVVHLKLVTSCPMKLQKYPFDVQTCPIMFESFGHTMDTMYYSWLERAVEIDPSVTLPSYTLTKTLKYDCSQNYTAGAFPCLEVRFMLARDQGLYFLQYFFPSILTLIISWLSFWMNSDKYPERLLLLLLLMLILLFQYAITNSNVLHVSYVKASDVWMIICLLFVFFAMLEATVVKALGSNPTKPNEEGDDSGTSAVGDYATLMGKVYTPSEVRRVIDIVCRIAFPVLFLLISIIFFSVYNG